MTFDLIVTLVLSVFLVLVTIDRQHDANRVLYVKAIWPRPVFGGSAWTSTIFTKHALLAFSKIQQWHILKTKVYKEKPSTPAQLRETILRVWCTQISPSVCKTLVHSMPKRVADVLKNKGQYTTKY